MAKKIELLAPGGDVDSIKSAVLAGADAVYCGLDRFNARSRAANITLADLNGIVRFAHGHDCEIFLTLNIVIIESEIPAFIRLLNNLVNTNIDGVIVQDLGVFYLLATYFPTLKIHASTQLTTHNAGQISFLSILTARRVNLCRELSLAEIKDLTITAHAQKILTEVFVHGSYCISFSGLCGFSSVHGGKSGNRGRCSQPCRGQYLTTAAGIDFPLNLKDNSAYSSLLDLAEAGVDSLKIEGRIKKFHYVYTVVKVWRQQLDDFYHGKALAHQSQELYKVFNRDFSDGFLQGDISNEMFIDNSRDNSAIHLAELKGGVTDENISKAKRELYDLKTDIITKIRGKISRLSIEKSSLDIIISGRAGAALNIDIKTPATTFSLHSVGMLSLINKENSPARLDHELFLKRFKALNDTEYFIDHIDLTNLGNDLFIPFKELSSIKKKILIALNGGRKIVKPSAVPSLTGVGQGLEKPALALLISARQDLYLAAETGTDIYFQLPNSFRDASSELTDVFSENKGIFPWFPAVLMGDNYQSAVEFLHKVQPERIVTNNTGIAYAAYKREIPWIAGPALNTVNSFSLQCLKEKFNCYGAFISNEINRKQIMSIKKPADFELFYSIYHPLALVTSRQCLFQQVTGCEKTRIDDTCIQHCEKTAVITDLKNNSFRIEKTKGSYHRIYNDIKFLNTDISTDIPARFAAFFIDLRDVKTATKIGVDKASLVRMFADHLAGDPNAAGLIKKNIYPTTQRQYEKGI